jgi:hypothetical protein
MRTTTNIPLWRVIRQVVDPLGDMIPLEAITLNLPLKSEEQMIAQDIATFFLLLVAPH